MKSISQIFKDSPELLDHPEVQKLIDYCQELEGNIMYTKQDEQFSFESKLTELVRDIFSSTIQVIVAEEEHQRFNFEKPDYELAINNLKTYLQKFAVDNNFRM